MCKNSDLHVLEKQQILEARVFFVLQKHLANECRNAEYSYYLMSVYPAGLINVARGASGDIS